MSDVIGRSVIEVVADSTELTVGMAQATKVVEKFEKSAVDSANKTGAAFTKAGAETSRATDQLDATARRYIASLERESMAIGKTRSEYLELRAAKMGLSAQAAPFIAQIRESERTLNAYGLSAKQTAAAMRGVPAQLTDIIVSLQSGQAPLNVLLQQGGQLKDMFGGIAPAARALGGAALSLVNPLTLAGGAVLGLGVAYLAGSKQADAYVRSIIASGGASGETVSSLNRQAVAVGDVTGQYGVAREAAVALAESGRFSGEQLQTALRGVVSGVGVTGRSVSELVQVFEEIGRNPTQAIAKYNERYNFLTSDIYRQIRALEEQGRTQDAATLAFNQFADAMQNRRQDINDNLSWWGRAWRGIKAEIGAAADNLEALQRTPTLERQLSTARNQLQSMIQTAGPNLMPGTRAAQEIEQQREIVKMLDRTLGAQQLVAQERAKAAASAREAAAADQAIASITKGTLNDQQKLNAALKAYRDQLDILRRTDPTSERLNPETIARTEAAIIKQFEKTARPKQYQDDAATRMLAQLREAEAVLQMQLSTTERLGASEKALVEFNQQIADLKSKDILTADQKSLLANEQALRVQLERNAAIEKQVRDTEAAAKAAKEADEFIRRIQQQTSRMSAGRQDAYGQRLQTMPLGDRAQEQLREQLRIRREYGELEARFISDAPKTMEVGGEEYARGLQAIRQELALALADNDAFYRRMRDLEGDWSVGTSRALQNYLDNVANVSAQTEQFVTGAFKGMEDALVQFAMTGKLNLKSLSDYAVAEITRIIIKQQISNALGVAGSSSGIGGFLGAAAGALFGVSGQAAVASALPGNAMDNLMNLTGGFGTMPRATGGGVYAGRAYEVAENAPELLNWNGRQILMMGNQSGHVTPLKSGGQRPVEVKNNFSIQGPVDRRTEQQIAVKAGLSIQRAMSRLA